MEAPITNIQGYSIHDGPGIRTVVFFKGCPLRCKWCANPENLDAGVQVGFLKNLCVNCGRCAGGGGGSNTGASVSNSGGNGSIVGNVAGVGGGGGGKCPEGAIVPGEGVYRIDREKCTGCGSCVGSCYNGALVRYGEMTTPEAVFAKVRRDKMFYDSSGGGVTVSGGEPLIYPGFVFELFSACADAGIDTCVETCGFVPAEAVRRVLPVTGLFLFDLKSMDPAVHMSITGQSNDLILENARLVASEGRGVLFRLPLIPGINDGDDNIGETAEFVKSLAVVSAELQIMPYHRAGQTKYDALSMVCETAGTEIMDAAGIEAVRQKFIDNGVDCTISA